MRALRLRILLLFVTVLVLSVGAIGGALRLVPESGVMAAFVAAAFLLLAILTAAWFVLDQTLARPIDRLAAAMRNHAHNDARRRCPPQRPFPRKPKASHRNAKG